MLSMEDFVKIQALVKRGVYRCDIAHRPGVHPKTVSSALKRGGPPSGKRRRRKSFLDPYRAEVDRLLSEGVWNAVVIMRELKSQGYRGGISILRDYIQPKRPLREGRATARFETEPGQQMQSDWARCASGVRPMRLKLPWCPASAPLPGAQGPAASGG